MLTLDTMFGALWSVSSRITGRAVDFVILLILARALTPADFGLTALAISLVGVIDTVLEVQLVQALTRVKAVTRAHLDTAFTIGLLRSVALFALVVAASWPVSLLYDDHQLAKLVLVLSIGPMSRGLVSPSMVKFTSAMKFRQVFMIEVAGKLFAAIVSMTVLFLSGGYWAIVANTVASPVMMVAASYVLAPYRPALDLREWPEFRVLLGWLSLAQLISALNWQLDRLILGRFIPSPTLGQYAMASDLAVLPTQSIIGPAMVPLMAAFTKLDDDRIRLRSAYLRAARLSMMIAAPACIGMAMTAHGLTLVLLGPKWTEAGAYVQWISLTILLGAYFQPLHALLLVIRKTHLVFRINMAEFVLRLAIIPAAIAFFSIAGVIGGRAVISVIVFGLCLETARRFAMVPIGEQIQNLWKVAAACAAMATVVALVRAHLAAADVPAVAALALEACSGATVYVGLLFGLGVRLHRPDTRFA